MGNDRLAKNASILVLLGAVVLAASKASAGGPGHDDWRIDDARAGYAVPIQAVYQFPAALVNQPGVKPPVAPPVPLHIWVGEHHVINR